MRQISDEDRAMLAQRCAELKQRLEQSRALFDTMLAEASSTLDAMLTEVQQDTTLDALLAEMEANKHVLAD